VLGEERWREQALHTLDFIVNELFDERHGVYHYWDGNYHLPGMLSDQAYVLRALVDALQYTGEGRFLAPARKLADLTIENLQSPSGGFYDTPHDPSAYGGLRRRNRSILENAVMAEALLRLSRFAARGRLHRHGPRHARELRQRLQALRAFVAGYARAVDLFFHEPVHVTIVGARGSEQSRQLAEAALRPYVSSRIVQILDPCTTRSSSSAPACPARAACSSPPAPTSNAAAAAWRRRPTRCGCRP
jgi:uncharacterized protein YyaL (SSP411 family)